MRLSAMLLHVVVALSLALPGTVLSRSLKGLATEEGQLEGQADSVAAGMMLGAHSSGWVTGADGGELAGGGGALRRLAMPRRAPVRLNRCALQTLTQRVSIPPFA